MKIILINESVIECQAAAVDDGFIITDDGLKIPVETIDRFEPTPQKWIDIADEIDAKYGMHDYKCPTCGTRAMDFIAGSENWWCAEAPNYCPNCGAKMEGNKK